VQLVASRVSGCWGCSEIKCPNLLDSRNVADFMDGDELVDLCDIKPHIQAAALLNSLF